MQKSSSNLDADGDARPEVRTVEVSGKPACQAIDLNRDAVVDVWVFYDAAGQIRRREYAYGRDAAITEVRLYKGGAVSEIQQATVLPGTIDTWHQVERGKVSRSERDANGDGRIDEWWEYPNAAKPDCPTMYSDANGDGKRDEKAGVDLCAAGYVPPARDEFRHRSPDFQRPEAVPTEVESDEGGTTDAP